MRRSSHDVAVTLWADGSMGDVTPKVGLPSRPNTTATAPSLIYSHVFLLLNLPFFIHPFPPATAGQHMT